MTAVETKPARDANAASNKKHKSKKRSQAPSGGRSLMKKGQTGWEVELKDLAPNEAEMRLYNPELPLELRFFNAIKSFRSFRRFSPLKAKIFQDYLHFGGCYMSALSRRYGEDWREFEEDDDLSRPAKPREKTRRGNPMPAPHPSEDKLLQALEDQYELVPDIEGVVRAFLSDYIVQQGHDRNLHYLETAAVVVFSLMKFLVQRNALQEHKEAVQRAFEVAMFATKALPATFHLPAHLPSRLDKAVALILKRDGCIKSLDKSESIAEPVAPIPQGLGWAQPKEEEYTAALELIHADLAPPTAAGWKIGRRSRYTARRILEVVVPVQQSLWEMEVPNPSIKLSAHTERKGANYKPEGEMGPFEIGISAQAVPHVHADLVIEGDFVELVSPDSEKTAWIIETLWAIEPGYYLPCGDDFGEMEEGQDGAEEA